jgi:hypothetical protein
MDAQAQALCEVPAEGFVAIGGQAKLVIEMREGGDVETAVPCEIAQKKYEGDRVGAAGNPNQQTCARRTELMPLDGLPNTLVKL